jgi:hypothetical protein
MTLPYAFSLSELVDEIHSIAARAYQSAPQGGPTLCDLLADSERLQDLACALREGMRETVALQTPRDVLDDASGPFGEA